MSSSRYYRFCFFIALIMVTGCFQKKLYVLDSPVKHLNIPIFVQMPLNALVFDNIGPLLYQSLHQHYARVGYALVDINSGYTIQVTIKSLDPINKLVAPDIILMHSTIRIVLDCALLDFNNQTIAQKVFFVSTLISKSKNPILNSDFLDFEYKRLCEKAAPRIERFFRGFLLASFS